CELTGYNGGYIRLLGYTPEMRDSLERERQEYAAAYQAWYSKQGLKTI
ncbi:molecular chaperone DnaJ, partial [Parabacteroides merdae]|nr:molecular chaperone DnaJ [Parabacteroides distasonis]MDB8934954.1 molecular chaperone DnaJ [Parabacteroides merdae]